MENPCSWRQFITGRTFRFWSMPLFLQSLLYITPSFLATFVLLPGIGSNQPKRLALFYTGAHGYLTAVLSLPACLSHTVSLCSLLP